ncbi:hypothetical protein SAMN02910400_01963 [Lachnospiraceae bacterium C10]|jgi:predicted DNA-binding protein YlxM (UPF0122 family)|nr:DNA-binding protein [Lachnospiraceae bacterium]SCW70234.1 hypothetical protein SAMN02910400_01963 [Lachnospiraceae bacterium C10]SDW28699.1 hypothetical protein SAMN05216391_10484 [Lachnospiraceae bacterium KHCPX20]
MDEKVRRGLLYDFYGDLLKAHQQEIYKEYAYEDLSLSEIAEEVGMSRQGVSDQIRRCSKTLEGYENALHLLEKFQRIRQAAEEIQQTKDLDEAHALAKQILAEL